MRITWVIDIGKPSLICRVGSSKTWSLAIQTSDVQVRGKTGSDHLVKNAMRVARDSSGVSTWRQSVEGGKLAEGDCDIFKILWHLAHVLSLCCLRINLSIFFYLH